MEHEVREDDQLTGATGITPNVEGGGSKRKVENISKFGSLLRGMDYLAKDNRSPTEEGPAQPDLEETDDSSRIETSLVRNCVEAMDLDDKNDSTMDEAGDEEAFSSRLTRDSPASSSSSTSSWPRPSAWPSRKRRQGDWEDNSDTNELGAVADITVSDEELEEEDQELKKRKRTGRENSDDDDENAQNEEEETRANGIENEGQGEGQFYNNEQFFDLFVSDSEDEESRNEWNRRRPAVFLRPRADNDRHGNSDRNAQEVVTRRMRSEYKPANNRCSLLIPNAAPLRSFSTTSPSVSPTTSRERPESCDIPKTWRRSSERSLLTLLRMREIGGRLGGQYGEVGWRNGLGFTRQVRRSSHMLRRLRRKTVLNAHSGCVNALNFSPVDGNLIASGSDDQQIAISDWMREKVVTKVDSGHEMNIFQTRFLYESQNLLVASCARDGMVRLSQMNSSGDLVLSKLLFHHNDSCNKIAVHPHEPHTLISCGEDALVVHMDIREPDSENRYFQSYDVTRAATVPLYSIHMHPTRSYEFCVCGRNPTIRVYDRRKISWSSVGARLSSSRSDLTQEYVDPVQTFCAFSEQPGGQGKEKPLWGDDSVTEEENEVPEEPEGAGDSEDKDGEQISDSTYLVNLHVTSAVYSNNGDAILSSYNDADIFLFDTKPGKEDRPIHKYCGHRNNTTVKCVNFYGPDSEYIVSGSDCGNIFFWSRASEQIANFQPGDNLGVVNVLETHPNLPVLATSGLDSDLKIWTPEWNDELEEVSSKRWPFEEKALGRTVLENWMDRESAKRMLIGQSTLLRMLRIALQRTARPRSGVDAADPELSDEEEESDDEEDSDADERRRSRRDFCVQS